MSEKKPRMPEPTLSNFVASLASSALVQLGILPDPRTGGLKKDLEMARYTIDLLDMLKEKTQGNLTEEESRIIEEVVVELKLKFIEMSREEEKYSKEKGNDKEGQQ